MSRQRPHLFALTSALILSCLMSPSVGMDRVTANVAVNGQPVKTHSLRVLSYNIHHAEGVDGRLDLARIAKVISSSEADLVAVQEVDVRAMRTRGVDQAAELARLTGLPYFSFGKGIDLPGGEYGNLVLSRFPIARSKNHLLPNAAGAEQRGVIEAVVELSQGRGSVQFFATHLDFGKSEASEADRQGAIARIRELRESSGLPALFAGDLNSLPESRTVQAIHKDWLRTNTEAAFTTPVGKPARQIDYIFVAPAARWKVKSTRVLEEAVASDHRAILAEVELVE